MWRSFINRLIAQLDVGKDPHSSVTATTNITRLFRNPPQLQTLSDLLPLDERDGKCTAAIYGVADGSEAISLLITLDPARTDISIHIEGYDICSDYLDMAQQYGLTDGHFPHGTNPEDYGLYFQRSDKRTWMLKPEWQPAIRYQFGDVTVDNIRAQWDLVMCQNTMIGMSQEMIEIAMSNLAMAVRPNGLLAVGGGPLGTIPALAQSYGFEPILTNIEAIHEAWTIQRRFYANHTRPKWALEPYDAEHPEGIVRYCTLFRRPVKD